MAEGSKDQGGTGTADPEEDSPNMIVYRKASLRVLCFLQDRKKTLLRGSDPYTGS